MRKVEVVYMYSVAANSLKNKLVDFCVLPNKDHCEIIIADNDMEALTLLHKMKADEITSEVKGLTELKLRFEFKIFQINKDLNEVLRILKSQKMIINYDF